MDSTARAELHGPPLWLRAVWFLFVGWWLTALTLAVAYVCMLTIIGLPVAFYLFDRVPFILTLKRERADLSDPTAAGVEQYSLWVRGPWFLLIGWWAGAMWITVACVFFVTIVGIPIGILMLDWIPTIVTLRRR